jgi:hypothetical protein
MTADEMTGTLYWLPADRCAAQNSNQLVKLSTGTLCCVTLKQTEHRHTLLRQAEAN